MPRVRTACVAMALATLAVVVTVGAVGWESTPDVKRVVNPRDCGWSEDGGFLALCKVHGYWFTLGGE